MKNKKVEKCEKCNSPIDFYFHECKKAYQEYLGCKICDDWCFTCNPKIANKILYSKGKDNEM